MSSLHPRTDNFTPIQFDEEDGGEAASWKFFAEGLEEELSEANKQIADLERVVSEQRRDKAQLHNKVSTVSNAPMTDDREQRAGDMEAHQCVVQASFCAYLEQQLGEANKRIAELERELDIATKEHSAIVTALKRGGDDKVAELESENAELRARCVSLVYHLPPDTLASDVQRWRDEYAAEINELRKDKARLDWLEQQCASIICGVRDDHNGDSNRILWIVDTSATDASHERITAREAIDAAVEAGKSTHE